MARRSRRGSFKRSGQYGWACTVEPIEGLVFGTVQESIIVAGDSDIEVRAVGGTHANLKRVVGDILWFPMSLQAEVTEATPTSNFQLIYWMLLVKDNDDTNAYQPSNPTNLCEERVLAHGLLGHSQRHWYHTPGGTTNLTRIEGMNEVPAYRYRIDVKSNRRIRSDDDVVLAWEAAGTHYTAQGDEAGFVSCSLRALLKFPA